MPGNWRVIAGYTSATSDAKPDGVNRRMAPVKLGYLLEGGYLNSWQSFYCPSSKGMGNPLCYGEAADKAGGTSLNERLQSHRDVKRYVRSGQGSGLLFGDYTGASFDNDCQANRGWRMTVRCSYNYRPNIFNAGRTTDYTPWGQQVFMPGTKPKAVGHAGAQVFATQRALGARALVSDSFEKAFQYSGSGLSAAEITQRSALRSAGAFMHKDGYNVLYGDGHAAWYGDPQRRITWWENYEGVTSTDPLYVCNVTGPQLYNAWILNDGSSSADRGKMAGAQEIWHQLDMAASLDVDAPYTHVQDTR